MFFFLAQTEQGDIFKITLETDEDMVSQSIYCSFQCHICVFFKESCFVLLNEIKLGSQVATRKGSDVSCTCAVQCLWPFGSHHFLMPVFVGIFSLR